MKTENEKNSEGWQRTAENLYRNGKSGRYYARVKVHGKEKWRALGTKLSSVAKLRLPDVEKELRAMVAIEAPSGSDQTTVGHFIGQYRRNLELNQALAPSSKYRLEIAVKALEKTWPELAARDARKLKVGEIKEWVGRARTEGTGFVAPKAKTVRRGMSASAFNKCVEVLCGVLDLVVEAGLLHTNPARKIERAKVSMKRLGNSLPSVTQFQQIVEHVAGAGARQSQDCADMVRLLAFTGMRLAEACALRWEHVNWERNELTVPGTKSETSNRIIPVFPPVAALFAEIKARRGHQSESTPILNVNECKGALKSACKAAQVKRLTHHDLRHFFATKCIEKGIDIPTVADWLGHADGGALLMKVYRHLTKSHSHAQAAKVDFA